MTLASILKIPGNLSFSDYVKEVWEEARYCKPLEITRKFSNDETIAKAGRVSSSLMKPFQRMVHIFVMKNLIPRFGKRDTAIFMDLTYMEYLTTRLPINLPRLTLRHMTYVINVPHHELPYEELLNRVFDAFEVPLDDKEDVHVEGEHVEKEDETDDSGSGEKYFDAVDEERPDEVDLQVPDVAPPAPSSVQQKEKNAVGVDPSVPTGNIPHPLFQQLQEDLDRARSQRLQAELDQARAENARLLALLHQATP
ncbi:hypothetical protein Dimus_007850 [Dionaea muscipula]